MAASPKKSKKDFYNKTKIQIADDFRVSEHVDSKYRGQHIHGVRHVLAQSKNVHYQDANAFQLVTTHSKKQEMHYLRTSSHQQETHHAQHDFLQRLRVLSPDSYVGQSKRDGSLRVLPTENKPKHGADQPETPIGTKDKDQKTRKLVSSKEKKDIPAKREQEEISTEKAKKLKTGSMANEARRQLQKPQAGEPESQQGTERSYKVFSADAPDHPIFKRYQGKLEQLPNIDSKILNPQRHLVQGQGEHKSGRPGEYIKVGGQPMRMVKVDPAMLKPYLLNYDKGSPQTGKGTDIEDIIC